MYIKSSKHGIAMLLFGRFLRLLNLSDAYIDMEVIMGHFFW